MTTTGLDTLYVAEWVLTALAQDAGVQAALGVVTEPSAALRIVEAVLPEDQPLTKPDGTPWPWVTFTFLPETDDLRVVGMVPVMVRTQFQVRVTVAGESYAYVAPVAAACHAVLDGVVAPAGFDAIGTCHRVAGVHYPEKTNGIHYRHLGGRYEATVSSR